MPRLELAVINLHNKFEVSSFIHFKTGQWLQQLNKSHDGNNDHDPFKGGLSSIS